MNRRKLTIEGQPVTVDTWQDPAEAAQAFAAHAEGVRVYGWYGDESGTDAVQYARTGNNALVGAAEDMLAQVQAGGIDSRGFEWRASPVGAYPVVGDFLAGRPDCMRRRLECEDDRRPLRVFVNTTSSGAISAAQLHQRGAGLLAFVMALIQERPVELWWTCALGGSGNGVVVVRCPTAPLNVGVCCHLLTSQAWTRGLGYTWCRAELGTKGNWLLTTSPDKPAHNAHMRLALGAEPQDVVIPPLYIYDNLLSDPVAWINRELAKVRENHANS